MDNVIIYTADNEMPSCIQCDKCFGDFDCEKFCGPEHGWYGYRRTERIEDEEND